MHKSEADDVLEQLLELLDERYEAGPTSYVVERATVEAVDADTWALGVVFRPSPTGPLVGHRRAELVALATGESVSPHQLAWDLYRMLEDGDVVAPDDADEAGIHWLPT